jgi:hypothetical protein
LQHFHSCCCCCCTWGTAQGQNQKAKGTKAKEALPTTGSPHGQQQQQRHIQGHENRGVGCNAPLVVHPSDCYRALTHPHLRLCLCAASLSCAHSADQPS